MKSTTIKMLIVFILMMKLGSLWSQSTVTVDRSTLSKTLRNCEKCTKDRVEHVKIINEFKEQSEKYNHRLKNKDSIYAKVVSNFELEYQELGKQMRKAKRKAWFKGVWQGALGVISAAGIVVFVILFL